jgi:hypothetical protein
MYLSLLKDFVSLTMKYENSCLDLNQATSTVELINEIKKQAIQGVEI